MTRPVINVTPLIDVLLVLLIIFMVITPTKPSSFEARIPSEPDPKIQDARHHPLTLVVTVGSDSSLTLNREAREASVSEPLALIKRLREVFEERERNLESEKTVFIKAPRHLDYGSVAKVIDAVKQAGSNPVSLQIDNLN